MKTLLIKDLDRIIKAAADANRIRILSMLYGKKMCVCEIANVLGIAQPSVSRHLKKLRSAGFIGSENEGMWTNYFLEPQNAFAKNFIENLRSWILSDETLRADEKKLIKADRASLCCK
jgi:ArsR family transcriptional regulator